MQSGSKYSNLKKMFVKTNENIRKMFQYANISEFDMEMFIEEAIEEAFKNKSKTKRRIDVLYEEYIMKLLNSYVKDQISNDNSFIILLNYIDQEIEPTEAYEKCIENLDKFFKFLSFMQYDIKDETLVELINKSKLLRSILETLAIANLNMICKNRFNISENEKINELLKLFSQTFIKPDNINEELYPGDDETEESEKLRDSEIDIIEDENTLSELENYQELLTASEERDLFVRYSNGEHECGDILFEKYRNLVRKIAHKYINRGVEFDDLEQEGNLGLVLAIQRFDYKKGFRLSTLAVPYIEGHIKSLVFEKSNRLKFSKSLVFDKARVIKKSDELSHKLGRKPSAEELAKELDLSIERIKDIFNMPYVFSLDEKIKDDSDRTVGEMIPDFNFDIFANLSKEQIKKDVLYAIENSGLSSRQIEILKLRYGIIDGRKYTQLELSHMFGLNQVVISREERKALNKIREYSQVTGLFYTANEILDLKKEKSYTFNSSIYLWELLGFSKKGTYRILSKLSQSDKRELQNFFGKKFSYPVNLDELSIKDKKILNNLLKNLKECSLKIYGNNGIKTIYSLFASYPKDKVDEAVSLLTDEEKKLLKLKYGDNLECPIYNPNFTDKDEEIFSYIILPKLEHILKNLNKYKKSENPVKIEGSLYDLLSDYSKKQIDEAISRLSDEDKNFLLRTYGCSLYNKPFSINTNEIDQLIMKIELLISSPLLSYSYNEKTIKELLYEDVAVESNKNDELIKVILKIPERERTILYVKYGMNLSNQVPDRPLSYEEYCLIFLTVIPRLKNLLNRKRVHLNNSLLELFPNNTRNEIIYAIENLSENDREIVYLKYGNHLENKICDCELSKEQSKYFNTTILNKIKKQLNDTLKRKGKTIYCYFKNYSKEQVDLALKQLSEEELLIIKQNCGEDLLGQDQVIIITEETKKSFYLIVIKIRNILNENKIRNKDYNKKITELFPEYTLEEIKDAVNRLTSSQKELVYLKYGEDLNEINHDKLSTKQKGYFNKYIKKRIKVLLENKEIKSRESVYDYFENYPKEKIDECINNLSQKDKELFYSVYNANLTLKQNYEKSKYCLVQRNILNKIRRKLNYDNKYIHEILDNYPIESIKHVINKISEESKNLIYELFGRNLDKPLNACSLSPHQIQSLLKGIIPKIKTILKKEDIIRNRLKYIHNVFEDYTLEELKNAVRRLKPDHKNIVYSKYGSDLSQENQSDETDNVFCREIIPIIKYLLKCLKENLDKNLYSYFKDYTKEEVDDAISKLSFDEKVLIAILDIDDEGTIYNVLSDEIKEFEKRLIPNLHKILSGKIIKKTNRLFYNNPILEKLSCELSKKEFDVLYIYINYCDKLTTHQIAKILNIDSSEVVLIANKTLNLYKKYLNQMINSIVESIDDCGMNLKHNNA